MLSKEITSTENKIAFARQAFNDAVMDSNTGIESFPQNVIVSMFQFAPAKQLEAIESPEERKVAYRKFKPPFSPCATVSSGPRSGESRGIG